MAEKAQDIILAAQQLCRQSALGQAIERLKPLYAQQPNLIGHDRLNTIDDDYRRLLQFLQAGFNDPKRNELYLDLLRAAWQVAANLQVSWLRRNNPVFAEASRTAAGLNLSHDFVRQVLTDFVGDVAMLSLGDAAHADSLRLHQRHAGFMQRLFSALLVSYQWSRHDADFYTDLLSSPTIDPVDQQLLTSAVSMACWNVFDIQKFSCLINVYRSQAETAVRQRALVGWLMAAPDDDLAHPEATEWVASLLAEKSVRREVEEAQLQAIICMGAPADNDKIQREIIPDLIKHSPVEVKNGSIVEKDDSDDDLTGILHPEKDDEAMERVEQNIRRITDMQKQGVDIYFGGFRMMKNFDFFRSLPNWFVPFYLDHPALATVRGKLGNSQLLPNMLDHGPFCDSDRYSFAFALGQVIDRMPANIREMLNTSDVLGPQTSTEEEQRSGAALRLSYWQDLFRFFNIYPYRSSLRNIFSESEVLFARRLNYAGGLMRRSCFRIASFLVRRHRESMALALVDGLEPQRRNEFAVMLLISIGLHQTGLFVTYADEVMSRFAEDDELMAATAEWFSADGQPARAADIYRRISQSAGDRYDQKFAEALMAVGQYSEAAPLLFKLYYNSPTPSITRLLARAQLATTKADEAIRLYKQLIKDDHALPADRLRLALAYGLKDDMPSVMATLRDYAADPQAEATNPIDLYHLLRQEAAPLLGHGISETNMRLVADAVYMQQNG